MINAQYLFSFLSFPDESMQKLFEGGKGSVFKKVLSWVPSNNHQLQLAGALAIANFARNGKELRFVIFKICNFIIFNVKYI